jgi:aminopeptidase N
MAKKDPSRMVRAAAIDYLGMQHSEVLIDLFTKACNDSSYTVAGSALRALTDIDSAAGKNMTTLLNKQPSKGRLNATLIENSIRFGDASSYDFIMSSFKAMGLTMEKIQMTTKIANFLSKNPDDVKIKGDSLKSYRNYYIKNKIHLANWKNREVPEWYITK